MQKAVRVVLLDVRFKRRLKNVIVVIVMIMDY